MIDLAHWPALVLTAGLATRLRPLSNIRAKAAMPVAGSPIIARILRWLQQAGIRRVVLNLHHRPETITAIVGDGSHFGLEVRYSWEREVLGSAGGPRRALPLLESEQFFIVNGDTLTDCDLHAVAERHVASGARVTMAVVDGDVQRYGGVIVDADDRVTGFGRPTPPAHAYHFIGVQAADRDVFAALPDDTPSETVRVLYPELIATTPGAIVAHRSAAEFLDVGTARDYLGTVATIAAREGRPFDVGRECTIAPDAVVQRSILWDQVTIGAGARVIDSILADGVTVAAGAVVENDVIVESVDNTSHAAR